MELIDKFSAVFVDESEDLIYIYCLRDILIPEDSLGQDCVAGLQIFFRTTFPVPAIEKKNVFDFLLKSLPWEKTLELQVDIFQLKVQVQVCHLYRVTSQIMSSYIFPLFT